MQGNLRREHKDFADSKRTNFLVNELYNDMEASAISLDISGISFN